MNKTFKILIIRFSSIGDIVLSTPFLETLKKTYPNCELHYLTLDKYSQILEFQPNIDRLICFSHQSSFVELIQFRSYLSSMKYDIIFDLHNSIRSKILTLFDGKKVKHIKKPRLSRSLLFQFKVNIFPKNFSTSMMYHDCLENYGKSKFPATKLVVSDLEQKAARKYLSNYNIKEEFLVIIPGAAWVQKQWEKNKYVKVINKIFNTYGTDILLLGSEKDTICKQISSLTNNVIDLSSKTTLREAMAIISLSKTVFGSDTGLMHIAESLGKNITMILGPTSIETGGGVSRGLSKNIESDVWCRPCSQNGSKSCFRSSQFCMDDITAERVFNSIQERI